MSVPVRVTNPGAESLGYLSNGEEVMAIYVNSRPPTIVNFNGQPPSWSSFGNKTFWGANDFVDDSPTKSDIAQRDKEINAVKAGIDSKLTVNASKLADAKNKLISAIANKSIAQKGLTDARAKGGDKSEIMRHEFKIALAELNELALKTEVAGYDAFKLHAEASKILADASSLRIGSRESKDLHKKAEAIQQNAKKADLATSQLNTEYNNRKTAFDKLLANTATSGNADLAVFETQQSQLIAKSTQNETVIKTANNKLVTADNNLSAANQQLKNAEKVLNEKRNTPEGKTITSPERNPIRSSSNHKIIVKDPMFSGQIDVTTVAEINNKKNLDYLLTHTALDYKRNILNDRNPVVTQDVAGDTAIYNAEVAEWDKLRSRLIQARDQIASALKNHSAAGLDVQQKTNAKNQAQAELNQAKANLTSTQNQLKDINQKITQEKQKQEELQQIKDAVKLSSDFFKELFNRYGDLQGQIAQELTEASKGKKLRSIDDALKSFGTFKGNFENLYSESERKAISYALESLNRAELAKNLKMFGRAFGMTSVFIDSYEVVVEFKKAIDTNNWRPFFVKAETFFAGMGAGALTAWAFSIILGTTLGVLGFALIMAAVSALVNDSLMEKVNKAIGI
ncbi:colicin-like pore-forming protein [Lelliottia amnigena]|uniref:colicin-like pore-forming protein n=1 Tax=Lelliottia amnigena TaxID=61646 RepID=UPI00293B8C71|nr:colicin-like pore-forming protein [Lelliottia amnigena]